MTKRRDPIWFGIITLLILTGARFTFHILSGSDAHTYLVTDDFYYYFLPAKNLIINGVSSFDGTTVTNGYHPLWFIMNVLWYIVSGMDDTTYFVVLTIASGFLTYYFVIKLRKLVSIVFGQHWLYDLTFALSIIVYAGLCFLGMETTVLMPLLSLLLVSLVKTNFETAQIKDFLRLGVLSSLIILSRLDTVLLIGMISAGMFFLIKKPLLPRIKSILWFCVGLLPLPLYFLFNYINYGEFLTVSALVKTLGETNEFNADSFLYLVTNRDSAGAFFLAPFGLFALILNNKLSKQTKVILSIFLCFPFIFYFIILFKSSWFLNRWYLYPLPMVSCISAICIIDYAIGKSKLINLTPRFTKMASILTSSILILFGVLFFLRDTIYFQPDPNSVYTHAKRMQSFVASHPGIYAMGDRAGLTAYLIGKPVIQLEGLACDYTMAAFMKQKSDLTKVLAHYNVDYLIETSDLDGLDTINGCYALEEPHKEQAGVSAPKMTAILCTKASYEDSTVIENYGVRTYIFKLK